MKQKIALGALAALLLIVCVVPFGYILIRALFAEDGSFTLLNYYSVFLGNPLYLRRFFRSLALAG